MRAQEREVISGWAAEVIGDMDWRVGGRVCASGKRIGEMKGLDIISYELNKVIR